jgi:glycosyltransferase involved in cell wall biosynthesis
MIDFEEFKERYQKVPVEEYPNRVVETMPEPMVSVHVGTYQHADFIHACMEGVLMQETEFPFEIIIGEDESDDGTREICKEYAEQYPEQIRLFLHRRENNIHIRGRPTGKFQQIYSRFKCHGKYIALCQGDDYWTDPKKLQKQVEFLESSPSHIMTYHCSVNKVHEESAEYTYRIHPAHRPGKMITWPRTSTLLYRNIINAYPRVSFDCVNHDSFLKVMLELNGEFYRIDLLRPSVRTIHDGGIWGMLQHEERVPEQFNSRLNIYKYVRGVEAANSDIESKHRNRLISTGFDLLKLSLPWRDSSPASWSVGKLLAVMRDQELLQPLFYRIFGAISSRLFSF